MATKNLENIKGPLASLEDAKPDAVGNNDFPRDELESIDHWVSFQAYETIKYSRRDYSTRQMTTIRLPLPGNLGTTYNIEYASKNLGAIGEFITDALANEGVNRRTAQDMFAGSIVGGVGGGIIGGGSGAATGASIGALGTLLADAALGNPAAATNAGNIVVATTVGESDIGQAVLGNMGVARNPHRVVLFEGVDFREHEFAYRFTPKSYEEAVQLKSIIKQFKFYAAPSYGGGTADFSFLPGLNQNTGRVNFGATGKHFFKYPEYWKIEFHHKNFLYTIGPSVITGIQVQYYPETNVPSFARSQGRDPTPTQIGLSIHFRETELVTKDSVNQGR